MKVTITDFAAKRHFYSNSSGTIIKSHTVKEFEDYLNNLNKVDYKITDGYAPFCKHMFVKNITDARLGIAKITDENKHLLKSAYKARNDDELPVLVRWFEGIQTDKAKYLDIILYSKEQLNSEGTIIDSDYGIVAILSSEECKESPLIPITMMRNALGQSEGGSGHPINRKEYMEAVEFWSNHAMVKN